MMGNTWVNKIMQRRFYRKPESLLEKLGDFFWLWARILNHRLGYGTISAWQKQPTSWWLNLVKPLNLKMTNLNFNHSFIYLTHINPHVFLSLKHCGFKGSSPHFSGEAPPEPSSIQPLLTTSNLTGSMFNQKKLKPRISMGFFHVSTEKFLFISGTCYCSDLQWLTITNH